MERLQNAAAGALEEIVWEGTERMAQAGDVATAALWWKSWNENRAAWFGGSNASGLSALALGDHAPLSLWLATFYDSMEKILGKPMMDKLYLSDVKVFNYAIPVVFQPSGDRRNGDCWDAAEYKLHFVPFSAATVYWLTRGVCYAVTTGERKLYRQACDPASGMLRSAMSKYVGAWLSDFVYNRTAKQGLELL